MATYGNSAANRYAARVDAVLAQRTRLRGPQPPGDKRAACPADHPLLNADPLRPLGPNLAVIASYIEADDVVIDVGGGAGRMSLPLALRSTSATASSWCMCPADSAFSISSSRSSWMNDR